MLNPTTKNKVVGYVFIDCPKCGSPCQKRILRLNEPTTEGLRYKYTCDDCDEVTYFRHW